MKQKKVNVEIKSMPSLRLSAEDEKNLIFACRSGDESARETLIKTYFPFVASLAKKFRNYFPWIEFEELIEEGNFGLLQALERFDTEKQVRFSSYAWYWIVKSMQDFITKTLAFLKVPAKVTSNLKKITKMIQDGLAENKNLTLDEITLAMDMEMEKVRELISQSSRMSTPVSLDQYIDGENQKNTLKDILDSGEKSSEDMIEGVEDDERLISILASLDEAEAEVIKWRFGFKDYKYHSLKDIAEKLGITPQKVSDLEMIAIWKLKKLVNEDEDELNGKD